MKLYRKIDRYIHTLYIYAYKRENANVKTDRYEGGNIQKSFFEINTDNYGNQRNIIGQV